jgi:3-oxoacyl-(acyl-carrier-protein) synthase
VIYLTQYRTLSTTNVELFDDVVYPQKVHWFPETYARTKSGLFYVPHKLAERVLDPELCKYLRENPVGKTAFILAGGNAHFAGIGPRKYEENKLTYVYKFLPFSLTQVFAGRVAQGFGEMDQVVTDASACASSLKVMMDVQTLINFYGFQRVIVLTVEDGITNAVLEFFGEAKAVLTQKQEDLGIKPSAFDSTNFGFRIGQGAALAVFETAEAVDKQGITPYAEMVGAYSASEASTNAIGQLEDGQGFKKAILGALDISKKGAGEIKIVKTHGTGTASNNASEGNALKAVLPEFVATSYKQKIGHTMGSSGLLETLLLLDDLKSGVVPAIENRTESDSVFLSQATPKPDGLILSLAAGMGNIYSAAIFKECYGRR